MNEKQTATVEPQPVRPTKKQKELLEFIEHFIQEHGYSPSYREIMNGLQYTSVATVALHVSNLIARGHLIKRDRSARSLEVVHPTAITAQLPTNEVKETDEKWLVGKVEKLFLDAEAGALPEPHQVEDITTVLGAMRILGLEAAVQSFGARLQKLAQAEKT